MRGADCSTVHHIIRSKVAFAIRKRSMKSKGRPKNTLNVMKLKDPNAKQELQEELDKALKGKQNINSLEVEISAHLVGQRTG